MSNGSLEEAGRGSTEEILVSWTDNNVAREGWVGRVYIDVCSWKNGAGERLREKWERLSR
jgi:hypothetical protein